MVRAEMISRYGRAAYEDGYSVYTTLDGALQTQARQAVLRGLLAYDSRHGFRGAEMHFDGPRQKWAESLRAISAVSGLEPAVVTRVGEQSIEVQDRNGTLIELPWEQGLRNARRYISEDYRGAAPKTASEIAAPGDVVRILQQEGTWRLVQVPAAQAALVSLDASDGSIRAIVGGIDFRYSKFNRAAQALRQPGSNIKPFIYAAAMENGFTPASIINDAPVVFENTGTDADQWRPQNNSGQFYGPTRLREGLVKSLNLVTIRVLLSVGVSKAIKYIRPFGLPDSAMPPNPTMALGSGEATPRDMAAAVSYTHLRATRPY